MLFFPVIMAKLIDPSHAIDCHKELGKIETFVAQVDFGRTYDLQQGISNLEPLKGCLWRFLYWTANNPIHGASDLRLGDGDVVTSLNASSFQEYGRRLELELQVTNPGDFNFQEALSTKFTLEFILPSRKRKLGHYAPTVDTAYREIPRFSGNGNGG